MLRSVGDVDPSTTLLGKPLPYPARAGADRVHPHRRSRGRAGRRPGGRAGGAAVHAVDAVDPVDRGGRRGQRRPAVVPGVRVARPRVGQGDGRPLPRDGLRGARAHGRHRRARRRERDVRRGFSLPPKLGIGTLLDGAVHPGWTWAFVRGGSDRVRQRRRAWRRRRAGRRHRRGVPRRRTSTRSSTPTCRGTTSTGCARCGTARSSSRGSSRVDDAVLAAERGVDAVALSNHGGRQLDTAPAPIDLVAPVADAVGGRTEIICDGGVRRGSDIVKAVALGATACMAGRAYLYAPRRRRRARRRPRPRAPRRRRPPHHGPRRRPHHRRPHPRPGDAPQRF